MEKENNILKWLKRPHGVLLALIYLLTVAFCAVAIVLALLQSESAIIRILSYASYAFAAITLGYSVYTIVIYAPTLKGRVTAILKKNKLTENVMENYGFKTVFFSLLSFALTIAFAVMNLVSAIRYGLIWYYAISAYYFFIIVFRGGILYADSRFKKKFAENPAVYEKRKLQTYVFGGVVLSFLEIAMAVAVTEMTLSRRPIESGEIMTIANAAYTFYKMTMAILNLVKARRYNDPVVQALRNINFADACMSIVSLTVIMLSTFGEPDGMMVIKAGVGFAACAVTIAVAVLMIVRGTKRLKNTKGNDKYGRKEI